MNHYRQKLSGLLPPNISQQGFVGITCIVVACGLTLYLFGWVLLQVASWLIALLAFGSGCFLGWRASQEKNKNQRIGMCIACAGCITVGALACYIVPRSNTRSDATAAYWMALQKINYEASVANDLPAPSTIKEMLARTQQAQQLMANSADEITQLSTTRVDQDAVDFAADTMQVVQEIKLVLGDLINLLQQAGSLNDRAGSASMYIESFMRGFLGDPLGTYKDYRTDLHQLGGGWEQIQPRLTAVQMAGAALDTREVKLRATLSDRYHRDFPPLSPPKKRQKQ